MSVIPRVLHGSSGSEGDTGGEEATLFHSIDSLLLTGSSISLGDILRMHRKKSGRLGKESISRQYTVLFRSIPKQPYVQSIIHPFGRFAEETFPQRKCRGRSSIASFQFLIIERVFVTELQIEIPYKVRKFNELQFWHLFAVAHSRHSRWKEYSFSFWILH